MTIYAVEAKGDITNDEWSIVTIWQTKQGAKDAQRQYESNFSHNRNRINGEVLEYRIKEIYTDIDDDCIYDYEVNE